MSEPRATYDTETVRRILGLPSAQDVRNLTRRGKSLYKALIRDGGPRGRFEVQRVNKLHKKMVRRALASKLGRTSPRFLHDRHSRTCETCGGLAVEWEGRILCENEHLVNTPAS